LNILEDCCTPTREGPETTENTTAGLETPVPPSTTDPLSRQSASVSVCTVKVSVPGHWANSPGLQTHVIAIEKRNSILFIGIMDTLLTNDDTITMPMVAE